MSRPWQQCPDQHIWISYLSPAVQTRDQDSGGEFTSTGDFGVKCYAHKIYIHSFVRNSEAGPWMQDAQCCARLRKAASFSIRQL